ncbi:MAG: ABC transporter permease, partial [Rhodobacteraceae bacterium]|nr:ABC transporter permease [Paracoccaceae bacterium]
MSTDQTALDAAEPASPTSPSAFWRELRKAPATAWFGMFVVLGYIFVALFADVIAPHGESEVFDIPYEQWAYAPSFVWAEFGPAALPYWMTFEETGSEFLLGTDQLGRDMLTRLIYGARNTVGIAFATTILAFLVGGTLGILAAVIGRGWFEIAMNRVVDVLMSIPSLIFILMLLSTFGTTLINLIVIIALLDATRVFRLARAVGMNVAVMEYVEAAKLRGEGLWWIMRREILPNVMPPLVAEFGLRFCFVFLTISALSFLGVGIQPPLADWGSM